MGGREGEKEVPRATGTLDSQWPAQPWRREGGALRGQELIHPLWARGQLEGGVCPGKRWLKCVPRRAQLFDLDWGTPLNLQFPYFLPFSSGDAL